MKRLVINKVDKGRGNYEYVKSKIEENDILIDSDSFDIEAIRKSSYDVDEIHIHNSYYLTTNKLMELRKKYQNKKIIIFYHDDYDYISNFNKRFVEISSKVDGIFCSNKYSYNKFINKNKWLLKYNVDYIKPVDLCRDERNIFWIGDTKSKNKHFEYVIELSKRLSDYTFYILSSNQDISLIDSSGKIKWYSNIPYNDDLYKKCSLHIQTSQYEGASLSSLEMGRRGIPTIAFDTHIDLQIYKRIPFGDLDSFEKEIKNYFDNQIRKINQYKVSMNYFRYIGV